MKRVLIVYHYIAHYRLPIFKELANSDNYKFEFAAGVKPDQNIKIIGVDEANENGLIFHELKNNWFLKAKILWQSNLISLVKSNQYDHIIFLGNPNFISTWLGLVVCKLINIKGYIWAHGVTSKPNFLKLLVLKTFWRFCDGIFLYGNYAKKMITSFNIPSKKLHVVYNSLDYNRQLKVRRELKNSNIFNEYFKNDFPVLIFIGRLTKVKKLHQILEAISVLKLIGVYCNIVFVGSGEEEKFLIEQADEKGLNECCWFYGPSYDEEELGQLIFDSKICVAPGNVGLTAMHSLVYGTPVISHSDFSNQMPEYESIEPGFSGDFFEPNNISSLVEVLKKWILLGNEKYNEKVENCYKVIDEKYNPKNQKRIIIEVLENESKNKS